MDEELFTLKWNNHQTTLLRIIKGLRSNNAHTDATLACEGKFFAVHKFVLSTCSDYFSDIFNITNCKNLVIVLKDIECKNLEYLLDYMYIGEINVRQNDLASLVSVAECLKIKGLAVPDDELSENTSSRLNQSLSNNNYTTKEKRPDTRNQNTYNDIGPISNSCPENNIKSEDDKLFDDLDMENNVQQPVKLEPVDDPSPILDIRTDTTLNPESGLQDYYFFNGSNQENLPGSSATEMEIQNTQWDSISKRTQPSERFPPSPHEGTAQIEPQATPHLFSRNAYGAAGKRLKKRLTQLKSSKSNSFKSISFPTRTVHTNRLHYTCPHCSYTCRDNSNFRRHVRTHTGEKPYHCPFCRYSSIHSSNLKSHMRHKHSEELTAQSTSFNSFNASKNSSQDSQHDSSNFPSLEDFSSLATNQTV